MGSLLSNWRVSFVRLNLISNLDLVLCRQSQMFRLFCALLKHLGGSNEMRRLINNPGSSTWIDLPSVFKFYKLASSLFGFEKYLVPWPVAYIISPTHRSPDQWERHPERVKSISLKTHDYARVVFQSGGTLQVKFNRRHFIHIHAPEYVSPSEFGRH